MIVVKIEFWPNGNKKQKENLGLIEIANNGTGTLEKANYDVVLWEHITITNENKTEEKLVKYKTNTVEGFSRTKLKVFDLVLRSLSRTIGYRNKY